MTTVVVEKAPSSPVNSCSPRLSNTLAAREVKKEELAWELCLNAAAARGGPGGKSECAETYL